MTAPAGAATAGGGALRQAASRLWHAQRIRRLVRARLGAEAVVTVAELPCADAGCPQAACSGPVTRITILGCDLTRRVVVIHRPLAEVAAEDLAAWNV